MGYHDRPYPETHAVLVRRHGVYVWGRDWVQAKTHAECYDYLFRAAVEMRRMGIPTVMLSREDGEASQNATTIAFRDPSLRSG
jgi:ribulose-5-phosphate 4-epimerase/fuculose-1-phosphate aldolase